MKPVGLKVGNGLDFGCYLRAVIFYYSFVGLDR